MDLSIIIPVYNVAEFVEKCVNSVLKITNITFEIIIIDDGSTDDSLDILSKNYGSLKNVRIVTRENRGLSATRNEGLSMACGEYVYFIDSDDFIDENGFVSLFKEGEKRKADVIIGNAYQFNNEGFERYPNIILHDVMTDGVDVLSNYYLKCCSSVVWRSIYRRKFLLFNNLFFLEGVYYEDMEWSPRVLSAAHIVYLSSEYFYYYRLRKGSICLSNYSKKKLDDALFLLHEMKSECSHETVNKEVLRVYKKIVYSFLFQSLTLAYMSNIRVDSSVSNAIFVNFKPTTIKHWTIYLMYKILPKNIFFFFYNLLIK